MPDEPEAAGLLALMLFQHSRRRARVDDATATSSRSRTRIAPWDRRRDRRGGRAAWRRALRDGAPARTSSRRRSRRATPTRRTPSDTDWGEIATLYELLAEVMP